MPRKRKNLGGRPAKIDYDPAVAQRICEALRNGCKYATAANVAGISLSTFQKWRARGREEPDSRYGEFLRMTTAAVSETQEVLTRAILRHSENDGRLALEMLSRRWPRLWPKQPKVHEIRASIGTVDDSYQALADALERLALEQNASSTPRR